MGAPFQLCARLVIPQTFFGQQHVRSLDVAVCKARRARRFRIGRGRADALDAGDLGIDAQDLALRAQGFVQRREPVRQPLPDAQAVDFAEQHVTGSAVRGRIVSQYNLNFAAQLLPG